MAETKAFLLAERLIPKDVDLKASVDMSLHKEARQLLKELNISLSQIKYTAPAK